MRYVVIAVFALLLVAAGLVPGLAFPLADAQSSRWDLDDLDRQLRGEQEQRNWDRLDRSFEDLRRDQWLRDLDRDRREMERDLYRTPCGGPYRPRC